nr:hypothetical protein CFP56_45119 [Quercus suber]
MEICGSSAWNGGGCFGFCGFGFRGFGYDGWVFVGCGMAGFDVVDDVSTVYRIYYLRLLGTKPIYYSFWFIAGIYY